MRSVPFLVILVCFGVSGVHVAFNERSVVLLVGGW